MPSNSTKCVNMRTEIGYPPPVFSVLMDFRGENCDRDKELWDPVNERCQWVHCGKLFRMQNGRCVRDMEQYEGLHDSSLLDDDCLKVRLNVTEYIPRSEGSIFVNASKKVYALGEFEVDNATAVTVCYDERHYTDTFTLIHEYLTLAVLSVSLVALALRLVSACSTAAPSSSSVLVQVQGEVRSRPRLRAESPLPHITHKNIPRPWYPPYHILEASSVVLFGHLLR